MPPTLSRQNVVKDLLSAGKPHLVKAGALDSLFKTLGDEQIQKLSENLQKSESEYDTFLKDNPGYASLSVGGRKRSTKRRRPTKEENQQEEEEDKLIL